MQLRAEDIAQWVTRIVIAVLVVAVAVGCASRSKLNRRTAEKLIVATLMKKPPVVKVDPRVIVPLMMERRSEWETLLSSLRERGYSMLRIKGGPPSFREEHGPLFVHIGPDVEIWLGLPEDVGALDVGPYRGCYALEEEKGRLVRYGKQVKVRVTGIRIQDGGTQAVVEYAYEWEVDKEAEKALERLQRSFDELKDWARQFIGYNPKLPTVEFPRELLKGNATMELRLYDDGWRVVDPWIFPGRKGPLC
jgi:hypothetical protein